MKCSKYVPHDPCRMKRDNSTFYMYTLFISIYSWLSHHAISLHLYVWRLYGKVLAYKAFLQSRFLWVRWELGDDSRRTVSVIWVGCYRRITIPLEGELP